MLLTIQKLARKVIFACVPCMWPFFAVYAEQLSFQREATGNTNLFRYRFATSPPQFIYQSAFELDANVVADAYDLIPPLGNIIDEVYADLPTTAEWLARDLLHPWQQEYQALVSDINNRIISVAQSPYPTEIIADCPDTAFVYRARVTVRRFVQSLAQEACQLTLNPHASLAAFQQHIQQLTADANGEMRSDEHITLTLNNGYSLQARIGSSAGRARFATLKADVQTAQHMYEQEQNRAHIAWQEITEQQSRFFHRAKNALADAPERINTKLERSINDSYARYYLQATTRNAADNTPGGGVVLQLDYRSIINRFTPHLHAVATQLDTNISARNSIERMLLFVQTIPYNRLQGREVTGFQGYLTPPAVLDANKGDCDSKSALLLSLVQARYPNIPSVMILIEGHAFVAFAISPKTQDSTFIHQGVQYVVAEPAGPATYPLGSVSQQSATAIRRGAIEHVVVL